MFVKRLAAAALFAMLSLPALAQTPATPAARAVSPVTASQKSVTAPVNVNTASAKELDKLPSIGKARAAAIVTERGKGPFKDWADFDKRMTGTNVNAGVKAKIKDSVAF